MTAPSKRNGSKLPLVALEQQLEQEGPGTIEKLQPGTAFHQVWEKENSMRPAHSSARAQKSRASAWMKAAAAVVVAAGVAAGVSGYWNQETAGPDLSGFSTTDFTYQKGIGVAWNRGYEQIEQRKLSTPLNLTLEDQGVTLTLIDVFYDGTEARINYMVENQASDPALNEANASFNYTLDVEGAGQHDLTEPARSKTFIDDHRFGGVISFQFEQDYHPAETTAHLKVTRLATHNGSWQADIPLSNEKTEALTRTFHSNTEFKLDGRTYQIDKIVAGPLSTWLDIREAGRPESRPQDELGFQLYDDKGNALISKRYDLGQYEPFIPLNREPESLTLLVTRMEQAAAGESKIAEAEINGQFPVVMHGYGSDTLTVTGIDFKKDRTILKYEVSNPDLQAATLLLTDKKGQEYFSPTFGYRTSADKWTFEAEYAPIAPDSLQKVSAVVTKETAAESAEATVKIPLDWSKSEIGTH